MILGGRSASHPQLKEMDREDIDTVKIDKEILVSET
jgi:hypothetical protein